MSYIYTQLYAQIQYPEKQKGKTEKDRQIGKPITRIEAEDAQMLAKYVSFVYVIVICVDRKKTALCIYKKIDY